MVYNFEFSTESDLKGNSNKCRYVFYIGFILGSLAIPAFWYLIEYDYIDIQIDLSWWYWLSYILILNALVLFCVSIYATTLAYPYSNAIFGNQVLRNSNRRYAIEVRRCIDRMTSMIKDITE